MMTILLHPRGSSVLVAAYQILRDRVPYRDLGPDHFDRLASERLGTTKHIRPREPYQFLKKEGAVPPRLDEVRAYLVALHADTLEKLRGLTPDDLDRLPDPALPDRNVATQLRHMITHKNNHHRQIDLIRGLRHPEWDLTPGTGIVQP